MLEGVLPWLARNRKADLVALAACSRRLLGIVSWWWRRISCEDDKASAAENGAMPDDMAIAAGLPHLPKRDDAVAEFRLLAITVVAMPLLADTIESIEWLVLACREGHDQADAKLCQSAIEKCPVDAVSRAAPSRSAPVPCFGSGHGSRGPMRFTGGRIVVPRRRPMAGASTP